MPVQVMAHMFWQAVGLRNVYVYIIYLVRTQLSLNDSDTDVRTTKCQAVVCHVDRGTVKDTLHLTDGRKWHRRDLGRHSVGWPNSFKAGDVVQVEIEHKITRLNRSRSPQPIFPYNSLWDLLFMVMCLAGVSWIAGFVASAIFHIEGPGAQCSAQLLCITSGRPEISWVSFLVFIVVFIGLWRPLLNHLERQGRWGIWQAHSEGSLESLDSK